MCKCRHVQETQYSCSCYLAMCVRGMACKQGPRGRHPMQCNAMCVSVHGSAPVAACVCHEVSNQPQVARVDTDAVRPEHRLQGIETNMAVSFKQKQVVFACSQRRGSAIVRVKLVRGPPSSDCFTLPAAAAESPTTPQTCQDAVHSGCIGTS